MSLAKKNRPKAANETVEPAETVPARALPAGEPEIVEPEPVEDVKPLGAHNSPGNEGARAAFLKDEANETLDPESAQPGEEKKTEALPAMSFEEMAGIATTLTSAGCAILGQTVTKRKDVDFNFTPEESKAVEKAYVPVLREALQDVKATPLTVLITVLLTCQVPRYLYALGTKPPDKEKAPEQKPEKSPEQIANVAPAPVEPPKEPEKVSAQTKAGGYGW